VTVGLQYGMSVQRAALLLDATGARFFGSDRSRTLSVQVSYLEDPNIFNLQKLLRLEKSEIHLENRTS
jgi:hypothetical protein